MELRDLKKSILEMTPSEQLDLHLHIRESRQTVKVNSRVAKKRVAKTTQTINKTIDGMTDEQRLELIKLLEEE